MARSSTRRYTRGVLRTTLASLLVLSSALATASPHVKTLYVTRGAPLAEVVGHRIKPVACGPGRSSARANRVGDIWTRVDVHGRAAQAVHVTDSSVYDLTNCRELAFSGEDETDLHPLLYTTAHIASDAAFACHDDTAARAAAFVAAQHQSPSLFCTRDASGAEVLHAVSAGRKLIFARFEHAKWMIERAIVPPASPSEPEHTFTLVSILDMNGDGQPEVVIHAREPDAYTDTVYTVGASVRSIVVVAGGYA